MARHLGNKVPGFFFVRGCLDVAPRDWHIESSLFWYGNFFPDTMKHRLLLGCAVLAAGFVTVSCSLSRSPSGFLTHFDQLDAGYGTTDAVASFVAPDANAASYHSLMIDPVTTVIANPSVNPQVAEQLAAYVQETMNEEFGRQIRIVSVPGPGTLRLRAALTDVISGKPVQGKPVVVKHLAPKASYTGKLGSAEAAAFISSVCFEAELVDSVSGKRLAALIDHRLGNKREATPDTSWAAVRSGASMGSKKLAQRLADARKR